MTDTAPAVGLVAARSTLVVTVVLAGSAAWSLNDPSTDSGAVAFLPLILAWAVITVCLFLLFTRMGVSAAGPGAFLVSLVCGPFLLLTTYPYAWLACGFVAGLVAACWTFARAHPDMPTHDPFDTTYEYEDTHV